MVPIQFLLIAAAAAGLWYGGHKTIQGVKKFDRAMARKFHKNGKPTTQIPAKPL